MQLMISVIHKTYLKIIKIAWVILVILILPTKILAQTWNIDSNHSKISFEVNHFFTPVEGNFNTYQGEINFNPLNLEESNINFTIEVASIKTGSTQRDKDLQSSNFFNVKKYPIMTFKSTEVKKTDSGYIVIGDLTIRNVTQLVEVPFKVLGMGPHPIKKGIEIIALKAEFTINRNDYGVGTGSWAATTVVGEEVTIKVVIEGNRKKVS